MGLGGGAVRSADANQRSSSSTASSPGAICRSGARFVGPPGRDTAARVVGPPGKPPGMTAGDRRRFMSGKVGDLWSGPKEVSEVQGKRGKQQESEDDKEFKGVLREVLDFVIPQLGKQEKKQYETQKIRALGGTMDKGLKMPYWLLQKSHKRLENVRQEKLKEEENLGVSMSASAHRLGFQVDKELRKKKAAAKDKQKRIADRLYDIGMGARERGGIAVIPNRVVKGFNRKAAR
mmetsp:Transcript_62172/g.158088  ORF Transcript_62172/g.158088 Transcript_62172/m.158088 type:complete len:234 (-) Transcript_62172:75-776(-)